MVGHDRIFVSRMHDVCNRQKQLASERTAWMEESVVLLLEITRGHKRHRNRIAHRKRRRGRTRRGKPQGACFTLDADVNVEVRTAPKL